MYPELHWNLDLIAFGIYPYISLSVLILGCVYRYRKNPYSWNSRSSEILDKQSMRYAAVIFHYGIILALIGHVGGLFVPQPFYNRIGFKEPYHLALATYTGIPFGWAAFIGLLGLTWRRLGRKRVLSSSSLTDLLTLLLLLIVVGLGTYNVTFAYYGNVLHDVAPWLRSVLVLAPDPGLLAPVPLTYKAHFLAVWTLFAFYPFSRLVHITSAPLTYVYRVWILFRKHCEESWR
jgi:nitrate reductase gamma subunit